MLREPIFGKAGRLNRWAPFLRLRASKQVGSQSASSDSNVGKATGESPERDLTELMNTLVTASTRLLVAETNPQTDPRWQAFVAAHPDGSIYHHPAWFQVLEAEYGQKGLYLHCLDAAGQVLGVLPLHYTRGLPFKLGGPLTGRRLSSLPRTPVAGPLAIDPRATVALLQEAVRRTTLEAGARLQIKTQGPELDGLVEGVVCKLWRMSYVIDLSPSPQGSFRIADSDNRYTIKKAVNKARRNGLFVRAAETEADLQGWYRLYLDTMRRNGVPARPYRFFEGLWRQMRLKGMMELLLAEQPNAGESRMLAGTIFFKLGRSVCCGYNGSSLRDLSLRPNDLLYWEAINEAYRQGFQYFDFGEVADGNAELARYKTKWGAKPVRLYRYYYPPPHDLKSHAYESDGWVETMRIKVWSRLPLVVTRWLGDRLYSYL